MQTRTRAERTSARARIATDMGIPQSELRTGSTLLLTVIGLWILVVLSRPVTGFKVLVIGAMMIGLVLVYSVPIVANFLELVDPGFDAALLIVAISGLAIAGIEVVRFAHLRFVRRFDARNSVRLGPSTARR